jgi:hypothetical protein
VSPIKQELLAVIEMTTDEALEPILHLLKSSLKKPIAETTFRPGSGRSLLRHAGTWEGDDFEECLKAVYDSRSEAKF